MDLARSTHDAEMPKALACFAGLREKQSRVAAVMPRGQVGYWDSGLPALR